MLYEYTLMMIIAHVGRDTYLHSLHPYYRVYHYTYVYALPPKYLRCLAVLFSSYISFCIIITLHRMHSLLPHADDLLML